MVFDGAALLQHRPCSGVFREAFRIGNALVPNHVIRADRQPSQVIWWNFSQREYSTNESQRVKVEDIEIKAPKPFKLGGLVLQESDQIFVDVQQYKPHPFPDAISGDIEEMEDDKIVAPKYFLVMAGVITFLFIMSCLGVAAFVAAIRWHVLSTLQRFLPNRLRRRTRVSEDSDRETPQDSQK